MRTRMALMFCAVTAMVTSGCPHDEYTLEMSTDKDVIHRKLTVEGIEREVPPETLTIIAKAYGQQAATEPEQSRTFEGKFKSKTPDDVGGAGNVLYYESSLGSMTIYMETFRGSDDAFGQVDERLKAVDAIVDVVRGFLAQQFADKKGIDRLTRFVDTGLRRDLKSLAMYGWLASNIAQDPVSMIPDKHAETPATTEPAATSPATTRPAEEDTVFDKHEIADIQAKSLLARAGQYLLRRNYVAAGDFPKLFGVFSGGDGESKGQILRKLLRHVMVAKAGIKDPDELLDAIIKLLEDEENIEETFRAYVKSTEKFRLLATKMGKDPSANEEELEEVYKRYFEELQADALVDFFLPNAGSDELHIELSVPAEPSETNGKWDADRKRIVWSGRIQERSEEYHHLPTICYAVWTSPNEAAQKKLFGEVRMSDGDLAAYVMWLNALSDAKAKQWKALVGKPSAAKDESLLEFTFEGEDEPAIDKHTGVRQLYKALTGQDPPGDEGEQQDTPED